MAKQSKIQKTYTRLKKPWFAPSPDLFSAVWKWLYILIGLTFGFVGVMTALGHISFIILFPFLLNLVFNFLFVPIQFKLRNNMLAAVDITLVIVTLLWAMAAVYPNYPWITYLLFPYLAWGLFATLLQFSITSLND